MLSVRHHRPSKGSPEILAEMQPVKRIDQSLIENIENSVYNTL